MISFASERGLGQDLATHLLNVDQNEYVEIASVRGAVASDLHGAFAEWEAQAHALTKCKNYLYSLSINPDQRQGQLTREQYEDYIARAETKLGLTDQPRVMVFHIKEGREHCHIVWSKVDIENEKAVHLAFDHDKLMAVTQQFARDHDLLLPDGYHRKEGSERDQLTLYEKHQERNSGLSKEERMEQVTDAWRGSDSAKAFMSALAEQGYILARGKRPYVLIDFYGNMNALPKMIDDKTVRTNDIRALLDEEFPQESLPTVEEAKKLVADHRKTMEEYFKEEQRGAQLDMLKAKQEQRRSSLLTEQKLLKTRQQEERITLELAQKSEREDLKQVHLSGLKAARERRFKPTGLAAFLGNVTGVNLMREKLHKYRHRQAIKTYLATRDDLKLTQKTRLTDQQRLHEFEAGETSRKLRALEKVDQRELATLRESLTREARVHLRGGRAQMPSLTLDLTPPGRRAVPHKAKNRYKSRGLEEQFKDARDAREREIDLTESFKDAAGEEGSGQADEGTGGIKAGPAPAIQRYGRKRNRGKTPSQKRGSEEDRDL
ncbi:MAG: relaxase/mobilization nuclease domain-containing protein [Lewinella sp.]|nr:relaxase/mobilization nuclease domain-containing protein [Lewinella sp.]